MQREYENILISKEFYHQLKENSYNNMLACTNLKVRRNQIEMTERIERISLRGIYLNIEANDVEYHGTELLMGYNTNNKIIREVLIPTSKRYGLGEDIINFLEQNIQHKYIRGFRNNLTKLLRKLYIFAGNYFIKNDRYGYRKFKSYEWDIEHLLGTLGEKKCIAYENNFKRLKGKLSKHLLYIDNN